MYTMRTKTAKSGFSAPYSYWNIYRTIGQQQNTLIAGTTGSGKSTVLHGVIHAICCEQNAAICNLWIADPKRVDMIEWLDMGTPQLARYANTTEDIKRMIEDLVEVMEERFRYMESHRIKDYDGKRIYLIVDELGDLVMNDDKITELLTRILQLGRAAGIRSIFCTQSPSRLTIKASLQVNFTARLALQCASAIESRQVINCAGAEKLPRHGKGIFLSPDYGMNTVDLPLQDHNATKEMIEWHRANTTYR